MTKINTTDIKKMTKSQLTAYLENLTKIQEEAKAAIAEKKVGEFALVGQKLETFPGQLEKVLGRPVSKEDALNMFKQWVNGKLGTEPKTVDVNANRSFRLSDENKVALKARMLKRAIAIAKGEPAEQVSAIADAFGTTYQTVMKYKVGEDAGATEAELVAALGTAPAAAAGATA
jgi:hypothetical protein